MIHKGQSIGSFHFDTINRVASMKGADVKHLVRRATMRYLEEVTELALAAGLTTGDIFTSISDALHNEAKKIEKYPSSFTTHGYGKEDMTIEISDNRICLDYIRHLCNISDQVVDSVAHEKLDILRERAERGELDVIDYNIYKKSAGRT